MTSTQVIFFVFITLLFSAGLVVVLIRYAFRKDEQNMQKANETSRRNRKPDADVVGYNALFGE